MSESGVLFIFLIGLVIFDGFVVAARYSFNQANLARLFAQRDQKDNAVRRTVELFRKAEIVETSLYFLRLLSWSLAAGAFLLLLITPGAPALAGPARWVFLALFTLVFFFFEELVETMVARRPENWATRLSAFVWVWVWVLSPVSGLFQLLKHGQGRPVETQGGVTQDELMSLLDAGHQEGVLEQDEREMIDSIFRLDDTLASEIMVPRIYITALDVNIPLVEAVDALLTSGHSRVPVYEDTIDNIVGLLYAKDLLRASRDTSQSTSLRSLLREVYFVPEAKKVDELLDEMQGRQVHMALVVDEYGGIAGLVTMEDVVEEIVGEIRDEYDQAEELPYQAVGPGEYLVQGRIDLDDLNNLLQINLPRDEAETLSGFIYNQMGRVPENGEQVVVGNLELTVESVVGRRIRKVRARTLPETQLSNQGQNETSVDL